jgi:hypothetical protein
MTYEQFLKLMLGYKKICEDINELYKIGVDLLEGKYKIADNVSSLFISAIKSHYNDIGAEWVDWFIFENDWGTKDWTRYPTYDIETGNRVESIHGARDADGNPIAYSYESLYELLEKDYKLQKNEK